MTPIYTKKGDRGKTSYMSGERVDKDNVRIEAYGTLDELNATLGMAASFAHPQVEQIIRAIQKKIFGLSSNIAVGNPEYKSDMNLPEISEEYIEHMENVIDHLSEQMPSLSNFLIPGQTEAGGALSVARSTCRRAERRLVTLAKNAAIDPVYLQFVNRLGDLIFTLERYEYHLTDIDPEKWQT